MWKKLIFFWQICWTDSVVYRDLHEFLLKSGFTRRRTKTPDKELSIAHPALFCREKGSYPPLYKTSVYSCVGPSERCLRIPWGKLYILYTFHSTKMGLDAQLTTFVSMNFIAFHQFPTQIRARLCNNYKL